MSSLLLILLGLLVVFILAWIVLWSDLVFYWSDPVVCPPSEFPWHTRDRYDEIFCDKPFENTEKKMLVVGCGFSGLSMSGALTRYGIPFDVVGK